jgi:hypothetical protein
MALTFAFDSFCDCYRWQWSIRWNQASCSRWHHHAARHSLFPSSNECCQNDRPEVEWNDTSFHLDTGAMKNLSLRKSVHDFVGLHEVYIIHSAGRWSNHYSTKNVTGSIQEMFVCLSMSQVATGTRNNKSPFRRLIYHGEIHFSFLINLVARYIKTMDLMSSWIEVSNCHKVWIHPKLDKIISRFSLFINLRMPRHISIDHF